MVRHGERGMKTFALAVMVLLALHLGLAWPVQAFSVKDIAVQSRRGEPFRAEVRLSLEGHEQNKEIEVTIGDQKAYRAEELLRPATLDRFRAAIVPGKRDTVRITSDVPIDNPKFDLLLLARSGQVTIVQHYPVKLAEAPLLKTRTNKVAKALPGVSPSVAATTPGKAPKTSAYPEVYGAVERGATLYSIVRSLQVPNDKLWQAAVVIWRSNKQQFAAGNMHGLPVGAHLRIAEDLDEQMATLKVAEAQGMISNQWDEWAALQRMGASKRHMIVAAAAANRAAADLAPQTIVASNEEKPKASQPQTVALPVEQASRVSSTELQTLLQGLEDRIMKRLTPTVATSPPSKGAVAFVDTAELQTTLQTFEERLTQRVQQMLLQGGTPVQVTAVTNPSPNPPKPSADKPPDAVEPHVSTTSAPTSYWLMLGNVILVGVLGLLSWRWLRRRGRMLPHERA